MVQLKPNSLGKIMLINQSIITDIKAIIAQAQDNAVCAVDHQRTYIGNKLAQILI
jgi:hypothetical protein